MCPPPPEANSFCAKLDSKLSVALDCFLCSQSRQLGFHAEAEKLGISTKVHRTLMHASACAAILVARQDAGRFIARVTREAIQAGGRALTLYDEARYDETSMLTRTKDPDMSCATARSAAELAVDKWSTFVREALGVSHVAKIVQTIRSGGVLYQLSSGEFVFLRVGVPSWLQIISEGKGENYYRCLQSADWRGVIPKDVRDLFGRQQRCVCTDADSAVDRAERAWAASDPQLCVLKTKCQIHKVAHWNETVFAQAEGVVCHLRHIGLALSAGGAMRSFHLTWRAVVERLVDFQAGVAPNPQDIRKNIGMCDMFMPSTSRRNKLARSVLLRLVNGCWADASVVTHKCSGCCSSASDCRSKISKHLVRMIAGSVPTIWPKGRWTGAEDAICWLGLCESVHSLLSTAFIEWAGGRAAASGTGPVARRAALLAIEAGPYAFRRDDVAAGQEAPDGEGDGGGPVGGAEAAAHTNNADPGKSGSIDWTQRRKEQSRYRFLGRTWLQRNGGGQALSSMYMVRVVLAPLAGMIHNHLQVAGTEWELKQERRQISATQASAAVLGERVLARDYHALMAAENTFEQQCMDEVRDAMTNRKLWENFPPSCKLDAYRTRAFCMLSAAGCLCHEQMSVHSQYPWKAFRLLRGEPGFEPSDD